MHLPAWTALYAASDVGFVRPTRGNRCRHTQYRAGAERGRNQSPRQSNGHSMKRWGGQVAWMCLSVPRVRPLVTTVACQKLWPAWISRPPPQWPTTRSAQNPRIPPRWPPAQSAQNPGMPRTMPDTAGRTGGEGYLAACWRSGTGSPTCSGEREYNPDSLDVQASVGCDIRRVDPPLADSFGDHLPRASGSGGGGDSGGSGGVCLTAGATLRVNVL